jgi:hypothetical protein
MATQLTRRRFTVDEYHRMAEAGILGEDDRVELLDGERLAPAALPQLALAVDDLLGRGVAVTSPPGPLPAAGRGSAGLAGDHPAPRRSGAEREGLPAPTRSGVGER